MRPIWAQKGPGQWEHVIVGILSLRVSLAFSPQLFQTYCPEMLMRHLYA